MSEIKDSASSTIRPSMLRPSKFATSNENSQLEDNSNKDSPEDNSSSNPFLKDYQLEEKCNDKFGTKEDDKKSNGEKNADPLSLLGKPNFSNVKVFAGVNSTQNQDSGFVFGQNLHERVIGENIKVQNSSHSSSSAPISNEENLPDSSLLFASAIQNRSSNSENDKETSKPAETKSLTEIAREYEESRAQKRKYEEVETFTGEENEQNIAEINCKLFAFENGNYEERSRGILRLNDSKEEKNVSRVVFRTFGTLRLLVNTKVWSDMTVESPSPKSLRLTAMDNNGHIKIFLAMSRPDDINAIYNALKQRIYNLKKIVSNVTENTATKENNKTDEPADSTNEEPSPKKLSLGQQN